MDSPPYSPPVTINICKSQYISTQIKTKLADLDFTHVVYATGMLKPVLGRSYNDSKSNIYVVYLPCFSKGRSFVLTWSSPRRVNSVTNLEVPSRRPPVRTKELRPVWIEQWSLLPLGSVKLDLLSPPFRGTSSVVVGESIPPTRRTPSSVRALVWYLLICTVSAPSCQPPFPSQRQPVFSHTRALPSITSTDGCHIGRGNSGRTQWISWGELAQNSAELGEAWPKEFPPWPPTTSKPGNFFPFFWGGGGRCNHKQCYIQHYWSTPVWTKHLFGLLPFGLQSFGLQGLH